MRMLHVRFGAVLCAALIACGVQAQEIKPAAQSKDPATQRKGDGIRPAIDSAAETGVHRMEIYNGPVRTVHYFAPGTSPGEQAVLRDLERAENELGLADQLLTLRRQYVEDERAVQVDRRRAQENLYNASPLPYISGFYPYGFLTSGVAFPRIFPPFPFGGYAGSIHSAGPFPYTFAGHARYAALDEGPIKRQMAVTLREQATPEYTAKISRQHDEALARAGRSERLQAGLNLPKKGDILLTEFESERGGPLTQGQISVTMRDGARYRGTLVKEDVERLVIDAGTMEIDIAKKDATAIMKARGATKPGEK